MKRYLNALTGAITLVIAVGAAVTSGHRELTGIHRIAGFVVVLLMLPLVRTGVAGWIALGIAALEFVPAGPIFHACVAPVSLAAVAFLRTDPIVTSNAPGAIEGIAKTLPLLVFIQIAMGAAYRHKVWGVMPHMGGAMIVVTLALILCILLIQRRPELHKPAVEVMSIVLTQVALGIASFVLRLLQIETGIWFTVSTVAHVTTGAATLAATVRLARLMPLGVRLPCAFLEGRGE